MVKLPHSCMAFKLENGETLFISKEDCEKIAMQIIVEGSLQKTTVFIKEKDNTIQKADILYKIMREEKNMDAEMRNWYLQQISDLLGNKEIEYSNGLTGETVGIEKIDQ